LLIILARSFTESSVNVTVVQLSPESSRVARSPAFVPLALRVAEDRLARRIGRKMNEIQNERMAE
jgi:hypothetical protein